MPNEPAPSTYRNTLWLAPAFTVGMLLLVALLLFWYTHTRQQDFQQHRQQTMQTAVDATAAELSLYIQHLRHNVGLFAQDRQALFQRLVAPTPAGSPSPSEAYDTLQQAIERHFPHHFAFTLADPDGDLLLGGLDHLIGHGCQRDIRRFADDHSSHRVAIHSSPDNNPHHFDIMVPWSRADDSTGIFFISFFVQDLARMLANAQRPGEQLILVRADHRQRIEVTADGARDEIPRDKDLSQAELAAITAQAAVTGTLWLLDDLPEEDWLQSYTDRVEKEALTVFILFTLVALTLLWFIQRSERALRNSNRDLSHSLQRLNETREHLVQSEKLAALGGLVAGVAHEVNTPVGTAFTATSYLQEEQHKTALALQQGTLKKSELQAFMETAEEGVTIILVNLQRAAELVKSFKLVASDQTQQERRRFALCEYLDEVLLSLRPKVKHTPHQLTLDCPANLPTGILLDSYPGALAQIITNLLDNTLIHALDEQHPGHITIRVQQEQETVRLEFSDDGCGMDQATVARIFEPFFTRNREGGGTGLGLHIVYNLVTGKLQGRIQCDSRPGAGTRFILTLPITVGTDNNSSKSNRP
jgi:signal transduction histidine kinase